MADDVAHTKVGPDGPVLQIEITRTTSREEDVSALTDVLPFEDLTDSVAAVANAMTDALRRARPDEAEVTFGIDATIETGKLTSMLVKGSGTATFGVRLLWKGPERGESRG
jgi:hypothetical protein